jgi:hypothetical protein
MKHETSKDDQMQESRACLEVARNRAPDVEWESPAPFGRAHAKVRDRLGKVNSVLHSAFFW